MKKFIDASDLFLKKIGRHIDVFLAKINFFLRNAYVIYIFIIVVLLLATYYQITLYEQIIDAFFIVVFLCVIFIFITVIGRKYYYSSGKQYLGDIMDDTIVSEESSIQSDSSGKAYLKSKNLLLICNESKDFYKPSKKITPKKASILSKFYNSKAKEFIDIASVPEANFINLISGEKEISFEERIFVFSELTNEKIVNFLDGIRQITGISRVQLAKLFKKRIESTGEIKKVNELKLNSSISQANRRKKG